jgi:phosphoglycolate phosphatase-like HAD superfamily hydrolase
MTTKLYALDFDGVICDSAVETALTGWKVATQLWPSLPTELQDNLLRQFRQVRPVMETGFEAILILRGLFEGLSADTFLENFDTTIKQLLDEHQLSPPQLKQLFGESRDQWIASDLAGWISVNPLYEGIKDFLQQLPKQSSFIITTKQERFVTEILAANGIDFPAAHIYGLDRKKPKTDILAELLQQHPNTQIQFVEDRLPTLINVSQDQRLYSVALYFAEWGYNTSADQQLAAKDPRIQQLNLIQLSNLHSLS